MKWIAVVVVWATGQWGIVEGATEKECAAEVVKYTQNGDEYEPCQPVGAREYITPEEYSAMKTMHVKWVDQGRVDR